MSKKAKVKSGNPKYEEIKEIQSRICALLRTGVPTDIAFSAAGICRQTFKEWMKKGSLQSLGPFKEFNDACIKALDEGHAILVSSIGKVAIASKENPEPDWRAAAFLLERRYPEVWGKREVQRLEHANADNKPLKIAIPFEELSDEDLDRIIAEREGKIRT